MSGGWEPISTAPQDGTLVELAVPLAYLREDVVCVGRWAEHRQVWMPAHNRYALPEPSGWRPLGGA